MVLDLDPGPGATLLECAEVARLAGVSPATASRVLNGSARKPGKDIADRVRQAGIGELDVGRCHASAAQLAGWGRRIGSRKR